MLLGVTQRGQRTQHQLAGFHQGKMILQGPLHAGPARIHPGKLKLKGQFQPAQAPECPIPDRTDSGEAYWSFTPDRNLKLSHRIAIAEHVMRHSPLPPRPLLKQGFATPRVRDIIRYGVASTEDERMEVLRLRAATYKAHDMFHGDDLMTDEFDHRSVFIIGKHHQKIITSARFALHKPGDKWKHQPFFEWPSDFPPKPLTAEFSKFCIHPLYQGTDVSLGLFQESIIQMSIHNKRYLVGYTEPKIKKIYESVGGKATPIIFSDENFPNRHFQAMTGDLNTIVIPPTLAPARLALWAYAWSDPWQYIQNRDIMQPSREQQFRILLNKATKPILNLWSKTNEMRRVRKSINKHTPA